MAPTSPGGAVPETGFTQPAAEKRYRQYLEDNHGDVTDLPRLVTVMFNAGARHAITAMTQLSDIVPMLNRIEGRVIQLRELIESLEAQD